MTERADREPTEAECALRGPFGDAEGHRVDLNGRRDSFVEFDGSDGLATRESDLQARVIVGRKGAGKTLYLRRARAFANDSDDLYADEIQQELPRTSDIVRVANHYPMGVLVEKWMAIWRAAILRSLASHLLRNAGLDSRLDERTRLILSRDFTDVLRRVERSVTPLSVYSQVKEIVRDHRSAGGLDRYLDHPKWEELEYFLSEVMRSEPPICFYIDAVDEEYRHAPAYWSQCQKGLFYQVMRFLRDRRMGNRLHVFICIRDHVLASVFESEHATRYMDTTYIRILDWDDAKIRALLRAKVSGLPSALLTGGEPTVAGWLGRNVVRNVDRDVDESVEDYLVRHTRLIPRDVVVLGNALCDRMLRGGTSGRRLTDQEIRDEVRHAARVFGREQLAIVANHIASDLMHAGAALQDISELYTGADPTFTAAQTYHASIRSILLDELRKIQTDRLTPLRFDNARTALDNVVSERLGGQVDVMAILWRNGLIGYAADDSSPDGHAVFYSASQHHDLEIRSDARDYFFHPCLTDYAGLRSQGPGSAPVVPVTA